MLFSNYKREQIEEAFAPLEERFEWNGKTDWGKSSLCFKRGRGLEPPFGGGFCNFHVFPCSLSSFERVSQIVFVSPKVQSYPSARTIPLGPLAPFRSLFSLTSRYFRTIWKKGGREEKALMDSIKFLHFRKIGVGEEGEKGNFQHSSPGFRPAFELAFSAIVSNPKSVTNLSISQALNTCVCTLKFSIGRSLKSWNEI